jgi:DNA-binding CsgD family transcriptional regulator
LRAGDIHGFLALLRKAKTLANEAARDYYTDILVPMSLTFCGLDTASTEMEDFTNATPALRPNHFANLAGLAARRGERQESRLWGDQARELCPDEPSYQRALILHRLAGAAFNRYEPDAAEALATESLLVSTHSGANRLSLYNYSILYAIAEYRREDHRSVSSYMQRYAASVSVGNDDYMELRSSLALLESAAQIGDEEQYIIQRRCVLKHPVSPEPEARFGVRLADVLYLGWNRRFEEARGILERSVKAQDTEINHTSQQAERALSFALLAPIYLGLNEVDQSRRFARRAISESCRPTRTYESPTHASWRETARALASATCNVLGDTTRARRAMSAEFRAQNDFVKAFAGPKIDSSLVGVPLRGYARFLSAAQHAFLQQNPADLTPAESKVISALLDGMTPTQIARHLDKSPSTVKMQLRSAYHRLNVTNRVDAIRRARELGHSAV